MSARASKTLRTGPFTEGELPLPFNVKFDEATIDFTTAPTFVLAGTLEDEDGEALTFAGSVTWADDTTGLATVSLATADVARVDDTLRYETRRLQIWTGNNGGKLVATLLIKYGINAPIGTPPSI